MSSRSERRHGAVSARDAQAPLALLEYLTTVLELRLFGQLTRCTLQLQAFCGQQKKIVSKLKERLHLRQFYINEYDKPPAEGKYAGATVIEPTPGYHKEPVACLDFMSLYVYLQRLVNDDGFSVI